MQPKKHSRGRQQRIDLLRSYIDNLSPETLSNHDAVDAACAALVAVFHLADRTRAFGTVDGGGIIWTPDPIVTESSMTMAEAIREALDGLGGHASRDQIRNAVETKYSGRWRPNTLTAHLYACCVNNPKAYRHHPSADRFLFKRADGSFEFYSEAEHGPNRWAPGPEADPDKPGDAAELIEASISLERDVEEFMADHLDELESGLVLIDRQVDTDAGRIDILAKDASGRVVIIELKVGKAGDSVVGQLARYLGWWRRAKGEAARGFIVAAEIPETVMYAASVLPDVSLRRYQVHVSFAPSGFADDAQ